ncbi:organic solute transporter subunit alpha-like [Ciona intestinalis]
MPKSLLNITGMNSTPFDPVVFAKAKAKEAYIEHCKHDPIPSAMVIVQNMDTSGLILHLILIVMATITVGIYIEEVFYLKSNLKLSYRRRLSLLQAGIPTVFAVSSVVGCFFPAGNVMIDFVCSVYFGFGLHALLVLMVNYYGGQTQLLRRFEGRYVQTNTGPFCCCCFCLPSFKMTKSNFQVLWYATFQAAFTRPIVLFFEGIIKTDRTIAIPGMVYTGCLIASMLSGMWALVIFRKASATFIGRFRTTAKFFNFQLVLLIANVQPFVIKLCYIPCVLPYTFYTRKLIVNYQIMVVEFFILSLTTRCLYRTTDDNVELERIEPTSTETSPSEDILMETIEEKTNGNCSSDVSNV